NLGCRARRAAARGETALLRTGGRRRQPAVPGRHRTERRGCARPRPVPAGMRRIVALALLLVAATAQGVGATEPQQGGGHASRPPGASLRRWGAGLYAANC